MKLLKIGHSGQRSPFALEDTNQDQFLNRPFVELWHYLASAPARKTEETKIGKEKDKEGRKQTLQLANPDKFCDFAKVAENRKKLFEE